MSETIERRTSVWSDSCAIAARPPLTQNTRADVVVIGAGITGLTTAYMLVRESRKVIVIDGKSPGAGQTQRTSAHLSYAIDDRYHEILRVHGTEGAMLAADSHRSAIRSIEAIVREENIACDFERVDGYLFLGEGTPERELEKELKAAHRAGLADVEKIDGITAVSSLAQRPTLRFPGNAQFHPTRYLSGLLEALEYMGARVHSGTHATRVQGGSPARVTTECGAVIEAEAVVVATNPPVNDLVAIHTKQAPYTSYVIAALIERGLVPHALYWDTLDPYHYVRLQNLDDDERHELLIVGGEDHKTGQTDDPAAHHQRLEAWAREHFPIGGIRYRWSGQVMETLDGLAYIGRNPLDRGNVFVATGDSGMGLTHGTIAGLLLTDLICGRENPWAGIYDPSRKPFAALKTFAEENLNVARQYADWVLPDRLGSIDELPRDSGVVVQRGLAKHALYRDSQGALHARSAVCTHLGCVVQWNDFEKIWDCPCHGSRFNACGKVITGPANRDLLTAEDPAIAEAPRRRAA